MAQAVRVPTSVGGIDIPRVMTAVIAGHWTDASGGPAVDVHDPATEAVVARFEASSAATVGEAVENAHAAWRPWAATAPEERGRVLMRIAATIRENAETLARLETIDCGKPLSQARTDIEGSARYFEYYGGFADKLAGEVIPQPEGTFAYTRRESLGVVAHITPWNAPLTQMMRGVAPCLAVGNTVVVKPSELTPITSVISGVLMAEAGLPPGVCNVVLGHGDPTGTALTAHELVRHITFTGSVQTGRSVARTAGERIIGCNLELGGKSPTIICTDADLVAAARAGAQAVVRNSGQSCFATTRLLVASEVHDEFVDLLAAEVDGLSIGHGLEDLDVGPLISSAQLERVLAFLEGARASGAEVVVGGQRADGLAAGHFVTPTVLTGVRNDMPVAREEIFGPVQSVLRFDDVEEALAIANDTPYGLSAGVFTRDVGLAHRLAAELEAGQVQINRYVGAGVAIPFGGYKQSGIGREKGIEALHHYTQVKSVIVATA